MGKTASMNHSNMVIFPGFSHRWDIWPSPSLHMTATKPKASLGCYTWRSMNPAVSLFTRKTCVACHCSIVSVKGCPMSTRALLDNPCACHFVSILTSFFEILGSTLYLTRNDVHEFLLAENEVGCTTDATQVGLVDLQLEVIFFWHATSMNSRILWIPHCLFVQDLRNWGGCLMDTCSEGCLLDIGLDILVYIYIYINVCIYNMYIYIHIYQCMYI